jgi:hypothetical protein
VGTVVEILADGKALEVEFSDREGRTFESLGLRPDQMQYELDGFHSLVISQGEKNDNS